MTSKQSHGNPEGGHREVAQSWVNRSWGLGVCVAKGEGHSEDECEVTAREGTGRPEGDGGGGKSSEKDG